MTSVTEIAPDIYRLSTYVDAFDLQFNQFLVRDDEPLLFHTGMRHIFPIVHEAVARLIEPSHLRWIGFSHFEADECGSLREWQQIAPHAQALCSLVAKGTSVDDVVALRESTGLKNDDTFSTGNHRYRFLQTPHVPHGWDASMLYEENTATLFCSDILTQKGDVAPFADAGTVLERFETSMRGDQATPWAHAYPWSEQTRSTYQRLAALQPRTLAIMHGSAYSGSSPQLLSDYAAVLQRCAAPVRPPQKVA